MAIVVPPFVQYQAPLPPLRGLWHSKPPEGDRFVTAEIEWGVTTPVANAVQFALSGNSPLAMTQICAFNVDNTHCGADVQFLFPDSGSRLVIPAYNQGLYPVFTNALMFYAFSPSAAVGDMTIFEVLNSIPPPVQVQPTSEQSFAAITGLGLAPGDPLGGVRTLVASPTNGTLEAFQILPAQTSGTGIAQVNLEDGLGNNLWVGIVGTGTGPILVTGLRARFYDGLFVRVLNSDAATGEVIVNTYFSLP